MHPSEIWAEYHIPNSQSSIFWNRYPYLLRQSVPIYLRRPARTEPLLERWI
ncbi:hypothetical protein HMPREF1556_01898 [Porphyromonas sp. oral taxon 278 str. W7784]|nr:hypothetical protein HMPREF1556_01898 [Porphyromonas sp. oral taxon 278 str. W7784]